MHFCLSSPLFLSEPEPPEPAFVQFSDGSLLKVWNCELQFLMRLMKYFIYVMIALNSRNFKMVIDST